MGLMPKTLILRSPGTNCDEETAFAFQQAGAITDSIHINELLFHSKRLLDYQILCIPGGFSYGDDVSAGRVLGIQLQHNLAEILGDFHANGNLILGICNGFQVLVKAGLLFPSDLDEPSASLTWNSSGRYIDTWVHLDIDDELCVFLADMEQFELPIAHAEGKFITRIQTVLDEMAGNHQLAMQYCKPDGPNGDVTFPYNPNGSERNVAGVCDPTGRIFGLMPHPERNIDPTHHPNWTRHATPEEGAGMAIFRNAVNYFT